MAKAANNSRRGKRTSYKVGGGVNKQPSAVGPSGGKASGYKVAGT